MIAEKFKSDWRIITMNLKEEGQDIWNKAYERRGNILFYPHEEIVRFVNKYVRKRVGITEFTNILPLTDCEWKNFRSVDIGCGIGRHIKFLDEFGLNPYGITATHAPRCPISAWVRKSGPAAAAGY